MAGVGRPKGTPKTGGRKAGTPNKRTALEQEAIQRLGGRVLDLWDTVLSKTPEELATHLGLKNGDGALFASRMQLDVAKDAAPYLLSKMPQRIAMGGDPEGEPVTVAVLSVNDARKVLLERLGKAAL